MPRRSIWCTITTITPRWWSVSAACAAAVITTTPSPWPCDPPMSEPSPTSTPVSARGLAAKKARGEKFAVLTAYDASFARVLDEVGVDVILVGDSLGMVIQGHDSTLPVTMADVIYH